MSKLGICEYCGKQKLLFRYSLKTDQKQIEKYICKECAESLGNEFQAELIDSGTRTDFKLISVGRKSIIYKTISYLVVAFGLAGGFAAGSVFPLANFASILQSGASTSFNLPIAICVWIATLPSFLIFWGIGCIMENQEKIARGINQLNQ